MPRPPSPRPHDRTSGPLPPAARPVKSLCTQPGYRDAAPARLSVHRTGEDCRQPAGHATTPISVAPAGPLAADFLRQRLKEPGPSGSQSLSNGNRPFPCFPPDINCCTWREAHPIRACSCPIRPSADMPGDQRGIGPAEQQPTLVPSHGKSHQAPVRVSAKSKWLHRQAPDPCGPHVMREWRTHSVRPLSELPAPIHNVTPSSRARPSILSAPSASSFITEGYGGNHHHAHDPQESHRSGSMPDPARPDPVRKGSR